MRLPGRRGVPSPRCLGSAAFLPSAPPLLPSCRAPPVLQSLPGTGSVRTSRSFVWPEEVGGKSCKSPAGGEQGERGRILVSVSRETTVT